MTGIVLIIRWRQSIARLVDTDAALAAPQQLHPLEAILFRAEIALSQGGAAARMRRFAGHCIESTACALFVHVELTSACLLLMNSDELLACWL